eukprot:4653434-Amphidinium_carterae.1
MTKALYGLRTSQKQWQEHLSTILQQMGFNRLKSDACIFANKQSLIYLMAYVDDLLVVGDAINGDTAILATVSATLGAEAHYTVDKIYITGVLGQDN